MIRKGPPLQALQCLLPGCTALQELRITCWITHSGESRSGERWPEVHAGTDRVGGVFGMQVAGCRRTVQVAACGTGKEGGGLRTHRRLRGRQADPEADAGAQRGKHLRPGAGTGLSKSLECALQEA